jgi:putative hydrolase of the HAD superfamily
LKEEIRVLKAVLFDLGETLVRIADVAEIHQRILDAHGIHRTREDIVAANRTAEKKLSLELMKTISDEFWVKRNNLFLEQLGVFGREDLARFISEHWWDYSDVALYPDTKETLNELKQRGLKLGVITNGLQSDVRKIMSKIRFDSCFFDVVVTVSTANQMKPEQEIFRYALEALNVTASEALFVGDTVEYDYEGAKKAGMKALLIDRHGRIAGDYEKIHDLREILFLV